MATTSPDNLRTPNPGDPYNLVPDLATLANDVQDALTRRSNALTGTGVERVAAEPTATPGMLWIDTDGINMIWRRGVSNWEPAVWRWGGTTAQMNGFTQAPDGFEWHDTTDDSEYVRLGGAWVQEFATGSVSAASGTTFHTPASVVKSGGWTHLTVRATRTTWTNGNVVAFIPVGFRPTAQTEAPAIFSGGSGGSIHPALCQISTSGNIAIWQSSPPVSGASAAASLTFPSA